MEVKTYSSILQENEKPIYALAKRVNFMSETLEKVVITQNEMMNEQSRISAKIDKICDRIFQNPDYFSVGEIALKQGISQKTVRRHIKKGNIPYERNEKSYRIPSAEYYQSLSHDGASSWFQNHTRE
jgi:predicted transcriptional regulator